MPRPQVLVVDDEPSIRSLLFSILDGAGYRVRAAADGREALELSQADPPDVVVVDLTMAGMDGREFVDEFLSEEPHGVVIVLTGYGTVETAVELMRAGVYSVLSKPDGIEEILVMVEKALRERRIEQRSRDLERRLEISERLAMIGKLAAGVAHELNNPLDGVTRYVRLTLAALPPGSEVREYQEEALKGLKRMTSIVRDLLTFSRNVVIETEDEGLTVMLRDTVKQTLASQPEADVEVSYDLEIDDLAVPRGMFQVFENLFRNAVDAMEGHGSIAVRARVEAGELSVAVEDDGPGIPAAIRHRVFEPFFTTKDVGKGTGLGLSIVSRIMERFGGGVDIESVEGEGTTVTVYLPARPARTRNKNDADEEVDVECHGAAR